jgi:hypothetical protein
MTSVTDVGKRRLPRGRRVAQGLMLVPVAALVAVVALAVAYVAYVLWPRWPGSTVAVDAPELPIIVGDVTFNVPPAAIRVPVQRRPGMQERLDLSFIWPSLTPPGQSKVKVQAGEAEPQSLDRVFVSIATGGGALAPVERLKTIYPRYTAKENEPTAAGLMAFRFREGTPYQGEDLIYEAGRPEHFFIRCTQDGPAHLPGTCLAERRMRNADITVRFPRDWLTDWHAVASGIDRLVANLKPH